MFSIEYKIDGKTSKYGNLYNVPIEDAIDDLLSSYVFKDSTEEEIIDALNNIKIGSYKLFGSSLNQIRVDRC